jgi:hypothetical protein
MRSNVTFPAHARLWPWQSPDWSLIARELRHAFDDPTCWPLSRQGFCPNRLTRARESQQTLAKQCSSRKTGCLAHRVSASDQYWNVQSWMASHKSEFVGVVDARTKQHLGSRALMMEPLHEHIGVCVEAAIGTSFLWWMRASFQVRVDWVCAQSRSVLFEQDFTTLTAVRADVVRLGRCSNVAFLLPPANKRQP